MSTKPTVVIIPGSWQLPSAWDDFAKQLEEAGYPTKYVRLPTVGGTETPLAGLGDDVSAVRDVLGPLVDDDKSVIFLCHSSGGVVGSNAVEGFDAASRKAAGAKGGVIKIVFMSAFMIPKGKSLLDMLGGQPLPWMNIEGDRVTGVAEMLPQVAFNDLSSEQQTKWSAEMTHTSAALFATPSAFEPWASGVPCAYIFCSEDNALPLPIQQQMAAQLGPEPTTATLKSSHCPQLSMPSDLISALQSVAAGSEAT